ncbi:hypothetical protein BV22DRAFT_1027479 [Leucogyrophana mollusca]|uniref:Uncharacterized protein n=1 Tax=Leucogyrophana mollusca TaxID=85980 RepID=A0ACB8C1P8_9AGAM|nr:hypothetical protein BV22DRAFT_1027479 [Leucogyrophana mollusca]
MDRFVTVTKPSAAGRARKDASGKAALKYSPYTTTKPDICDHTYASADKKRLARLREPLLKRDVGKPSSSAITKHLLNTLGDESNPITHSDIYERSDHIISAATGHQRSEARGNGGGVRAYLDSRNARIIEQRREKCESNVLAGVRIYINGYLAGTTDIEMKRIVMLAGGSTLPTATGATHILTSQQLSGSKTHKFLTTKSRALVHVVKPEWVTDSVAAGKRLKESEYKVVKATNNMDLREMLDSGRRDGT